jgi:hypothetical protein
MKKLAVLFFIIACFLHVKAQPDISKYHDFYQLKNKKAIDVIKIDGHLDEQSWQQAEPKNNFWLKEPLDTGHAQRDTEVRVTYDNNFLYVGIINYDTNYYVIQTLKRDIDPGNSDGVAIILDPMNARTNGFLFVVNPYNVQAEDLITSSAGTDINFSWDNKWYSQTTRHAGKWIAEMAIPFKTLRYEEGKTIWGINFIRADLKNNEYSTWTKVPRNLKFYDFGYTGAMIWDAPPPPPGTNISIIPYVTGDISGNRENGEKTNAGMNQGFDAKVALSSKLNLDITVNPDFSQIEVDRQVTNLTRFNIFFPERRTFFIENADLFTSYGYPASNPFYSRTIGLDKEGNRIPIYAGLRLTGNLTKRMRIGVMNMQTGKKGDFAAQNYTAVSMTHTVLKRSLIKGYYFGREAFLSEEKKKDHPLDRYGRNAGLELVYTSNKGDVQGWYGLHKSWKYGINTRDHFIYGGGQYSNRKLTAVINVESMGTNYYADMGFVQRIENYDAALDTTIRLGYKGIFTTVSYTMFPKKGTLNSHNLNFNNYAVWNPDGTFNENTAEVIYFFNFKNTSELRLIANNQVIHLLYPTSFTDYDPLPKGNYHFGNYSVRFASDGRKKFIYSAGVRLGSFYNGDIQQYIASIRFRAQPWGNFGVDFEQNELTFPDPHGKASLFLIAPRIEINFSNNLFWTTFIQYNTQNENININSRFQWRYKPMSDLFVVYTDNYFSAPFLKNRNWALVFKLNYWLNL